MRNDRTSWIAGVLSLLLSCSGIEAHELADAGKATIPDSPRSAGQNWMTRRDSSGGLLPPIAIEADRWFRDTADSSGNESSKDFAVDSSQSNSPVGPENSKKLYKKRWNPTPTVVFFGPTLFLVRFVARGFVAAGLSCSGDGAGVFCFISIGGIVSNRFFHARTSRVIVAATFGISLFFAAIQSASAATIASLQFAPSGTTTTSPYVLFDVANTATQVATIGSTPVDLTLGINAPQSGDFFTRGSEASTSLLNTFFYSQDSATPTPITFTFTGLTALTVYSLKFTTYDPDLTLTEPGVGNETGPFVTSIKPGTGTTGTPGGTSYSPTGGDPSGTDIVQTTVLFTSDSSGNLVATASLTSGNMFLRVNGLQISTVPEPGSFGLIALFTACGLVTRRRRARGGCARCW